MDSKKESNEDLYKDNELLHVIDCLGGQNCQH